MSHPQTHSPEDTRDSKPWGPGDKGARGGLTPTPTSAGGRASALPPRLPDTAVLGRAWEGLTPSPHSCFLHGKERASGISGLSCALMPLARVLGWGRRHSLPLPDGWPCMSRGALLRQRSPPLTLAPYLSSLSPCRHVQHGAWHYFCTCPDALAANPGPFSGVSPMWTSK